MSSRCQALTQAGKPCPKAAMIGSTTCWVHSRVPGSAANIPVKPITREREIAMVERQIRAVGKLPASLEKARTTIQLIELLERLRKPESSETKDLTVEERLALSRR